MGQTLVYGILNGALYGTIALGIALVFGIMKYLNVAHGALIVFGAYGSLFLFRIGLDPFVSLPIILILLFIVGAILFKLFFGRLIALDEGDKINDSLLIGFGLMLVMENLATVLWTGDERSVTPTYSGMTFEVFGLRIPLIGLSGGILALLLIFALHLFLSKTYFGKSVVAVSQDHEAASLMGINIRRTFMVSFAISVSLASIPSMLIGLQSFSPTAGIQWFNKGIIVVMLSGIGNIYGVFPAGIFLGIVEALSVFCFGAAYREVTGLAVFVLILIFSPKGLMGKGAEA
jgi:branched-chain amino acid transport system permease protein